MPKTQFSRNRDLGLVSLHLVINERAIMNIAYVERGTEQSI